MPRRPRLLPAGLTSGRRPLLFVAVLAILSHATALGCGFVWLDHAHLENGLALAPLAEVASLFRRSFAGTGFYRPLMSLSLSLDAALGGGAFLFHASTLAWHAAAAVMVVVAGQTLGLARKAAMLAGMLFAVHPATSVVADAIAFRSEAMIVVFLLALAVFHWRGNALLAAGALLAGALTKETALVLGSAFIVALVVARRLGSIPIATSSPGAQSRALFAAEAAALILAVCLRARFAPSWRATFPGLSLGDAIGTRMAVLTRAVALLGAPLDPSVCDAFPVTSALAARAIMGTAIASCLLVLMWRRPLWGLLLGLSILPALQLVPIARWWSPHYFYLPLVFVSLLVAESLVRFGRRGDAVALGMVVICAVVSLADGRRYRSDESLWTSELVLHPECREAEFYVAEIHREHKEWEAAALHYQASLTPTPGVLSYVDTTAALQNLGVARLAQGRFALAFTAFQGARLGTNSDATRRELTHNLAAAALGAGDAAQAAQLLAPEVNRADAFPQSILLQARALHALGRDEEAGVLARRFSAISSGSGAP